MSAGKSPPPDPRARCWLSVVMAYQTCERQYARLLLAFDLSIAQFDVLTAIDDLGSQAAPAQIAQRLLVTKGNITGLLRRLGERDLVRFCRHASDGRSFVCALSPKAINLLAAARAASSRFIAAQLSPFSDRQLASTGEQMNLMRHHLDAMDPDAIAGAALKARAASVKRRRPADAH